MVVAVVALFAALGGSAYAATKIGTKQIKNGAITAGKIKKEAVTAAKIKNGAITGAKVDLSTLGTVPNATHATTADSAGKANEAKTAESAKVADTATNFSRYFTSGLKKASIGQDVTVATIGPFTLTGKCSENGADTVAEMFLTTNQAGSNAYTYDTGYYQNDFEPSEELEVGDGGSESEGPEVGFWSSYYTPFAAESADGAYLVEGNANTAVNAFGADCAFEANFLNNA
jgi:hypothetical protein